MKAFCMALLVLATIGLPAAGSAQDAAVWREVAPENLVFIGMTEGEVVLELNPVFAPQTVAQFRRLVREDFYRGLSFYRVIEGFVAQAGNESDVDGPYADAALPAEFQRGFDKDTMSWTRVQRDDLFAPETGFIDGFPAGRKDDTVWLTHCPGAVAMARGNEPDSGSTDFYIVLGQAPRYLDRNLTVFARVIDGMEVVQQVRRGATEENGIIDNEMARSRIGRMRMADQLEPEEQRTYYVMDTNSRGFKQMMEARRDRKDDFFVQRPPKVLDVCQVPVASRAERLSKLKRRVPSD